MSYHWIINTAYHKAAKLEIAYISINESNQKNTIDGKLIGFFGNQSDLNLSDEVYGQILLSSCDSVTIRN